MTEADNDRLKSPELLRAYGWYAAQPVKKLAERLEDLADFHDEFGHGMGDISDTPAFLAARDRLLAMKEFIDQVYCVACDAQDMLKARFGALPEWSPMPELAELEKRALVFKAT